MTATDVKEFIKPLEWAPPRPRSLAWQAWMGDWWVAGTILGRYGVATWHDGTVTWRILDAPESVRRDFKCDSVEAGKSAAEEHYRLRIKIALTEGEGIAP